MRRRPLQVEGPTPSARRSDPTAPDSHLPQFTQRDEIEQLDLDGVFFLRLDLDHGDAAVLDVEMGHAGERQLQEEAEQERVSHR